MRVELRSLVLKCRPSAVGRNANCSFPDDENFIPESCCYGFSGCARVLDEQTLVEQKLGNCSGFNE